MYFLHSSVNFRFLVPCVKFYSTKKNSNLIKILKTMPKEPLHIPQIQKQREKIKERYSKYVPGRVTLQVLGTGAEGAPTALYVFSDQSRYLFNCGEGTQRLAHEHKMKLAKLEHIFITQPIWKNIGGLPGTALTIQDVGVSEITLHGPQGTEGLFPATKRFVVLRDLQVKVADCKDGGMFEDNVMQVKYVYLTKDRQNVENSKQIQAGTSATEDASTSTRREGPRRRRRSSSSNKVDVVEDDIDYYAHEQSGKRAPANAISQESKKLWEEFKEDAICLSYICRLQPRPGALDLEKCVKKGVPPGPLLGKLKSGESVVLANGNVVESKDVRDPDDPGPVFIVVDCPTEEYLNSLMENEEFAKHQATATINEDLALVVVHFSPKHVMENEKYKAWIERFSLSTQHLVINDYNNCMGSAAVHRIQYKMNLLSSSMFPLLADRGTLLKGDLNELPANKKRKCTESTNEVSLETLSVDATPVDNFIRADTFCTFHLRPRYGLDRSAEVKINPEEYLNEVQVLPEFNEALKELHQKIAVNASQSYPKILFLGTGSCIPNKTRNTSGILLQTNEENNVIMDCGEGTYGQIIRFFGKKRAYDVLANINAIYVSHLHADHHIGLIGLLRGRENALRVLKRAVKPVYLLAPQQILAWLSFYDGCFEDIQHLYHLIPNSDLFMNNTNSFDEVFSSLDMKMINTCYVRHCPNAFGVSFVHKSGLKLTYSGDTMPTENLVHLGEESDVLIHEATMEDDLEREALIKMHSTTSQAIQIGQSMRAKNIILTHFSQRYAKLPRFNDNFADNVGIAFDNMHISIEDLCTVPHLYPALKLIFAEDYAEMENKAVKRQMKIERQQTTQSLLINK